MKRLVVTTVTGAMLAVLPGLAPATAATHTATGDAGSREAFQARAYGTKATVGKKVTSGASAPVNIGCTTSAGVRRTNTAAGVNELPLLKSGTIDTSAATHRSPVEATASATVQDINLLSGVITGLAVRSASATRLRNSDFRTNARGTSFSSLIVAGVPVNGVVEPNTRIDLLGFGYVILNEQIGHVGGRSAELTVNAVHVVVTEDNVLGIPVGANVIVAHAYSGLGSPAVAVLEGFAYGTEAKAGSDLSSGPSFRVVMPCLGTNGRVKVNEGAGVTIPGVLTTGEIHNTARGLVDGSNATGETTSTVDSTALLGDLLSATAIRADANASSNGNSATFSDNGSSFATLVVTGFPEIGPDVAPNTRLQIAGLGTLWLHRVLRQNDSVEVRMIELIIKHSNSQGLPIGADIRVSVAHASVR